jgi:hypothetical protein
MAAHLRRLAIHFHVPTRKARDEALRWSDWFEDLEGTPLDMIAEGCALWRTSLQEFYPTPGQFLAMVKLPVQTRRTGVERLRELRGLAEAAVDNTAMAPAARISEQAREQLGLVLSETRPAMNLVRLTPAAAKVSPAERDARLARLQQFAAEEARG